jgi:hypothetical protein
VHDDVSFSVPEQLTYLPGGGVPVGLRVRVHKFFCDDPFCKRKILVEGSGYCSYGSIDIKGGNAMVRINGVDPDRAQGPIRAVFEAQIKKWGAPLLNHLLYARRPTIFRGVRAMYSGLDSSGLIDSKLVSLINRRVAAINGCEF